MTVYAELEDPGIQVIQRLQTTSPTIAKPTLVACVVAPCYQVLEAYKTDASGNSVVDTDANVNLPAILNAPTAGPYNLDTKVLKVSVNGGATWSVTFSGTAVTAQQAVNQINAATTAPSGWSPYVLTSGSSTYLQLRTTAAGDAQKLKLLDGDANTVFGWNKDYGAYGKSSYKQDKILAAQANFPDTRGILATGQGDVDESSIRAFLNNGKALAEVKRTEAFLRRGANATVAGTAALAFPANGLTTLSGLKLELTLVNAATAVSMTFAATTAYAAIKGNKLVSTVAPTPASIGTKTLKFKVNGVPQMVTFASPTSLQQVVDQINAVYPCAYISTAVGVLDAGAGTYVTFHPGFEDNGGTFEATYEAPGTTAWAEFFGGTNHICAGLVEVINTGIGATVASEDTVTANVLRLKSGNGYLKVGVPTTSPANAILNLPVVATEYYAVQAIDDGDGDSTSPLLRFYDENFAASEGSASLTGSKVVGIPDIHGKTLISSDDGKYNQEITFDCGPIVPAIAYTQPAITDTLGLKVNGVVRQITLKTAAGAQYASIDEAIAGINTGAGAAVCYKATAAGVYSATGTFIAFQVGGAVSAKGAIEIDISGCTTGGWQKIGFGSAANYTVAAAVNQDIKQCLSNPTVAAYVTPTSGETLGVMVGSVLKKVTFGTEASAILYSDAINTACAALVSYPCDAAGAYDAAGTKVGFRYGGPCATPGVSYPMEEMTHANIWTDLALTGRQYPTLTALLAKINATMGAGFAVASTGRLKLVSAETGEESKVECHAGTANTALGLTNNSAGYGLPFAPQVGDKVYVEGSYVGDVLYVTPGGVSTDLRLSAEVAYAAYKKRYFYIVAQNIPSTLPSTRPTPGLVVGTDGGVSIKHDLIRDIKGAPVNNAQNTLMLTYKALRLDVTPRATSPTMLTYESTTEISTYMKPITSDNPLGLGMHFASLNATGTTVSGLGVDEVSTSEPGGTQAAHSRAQTFLESKEVYAIAPLSQTKEVIDSWKTHVLAMSAADQKGERVLLACPALPTRKLHTLAGSGTDGDYVSANLFDTKDTQLTQALQTAGLDPANLATTDGVFLDIATDAKYYSVESVTGTQVKLRTSFSAGDNDDSFYTTSSIPTTLISETFTVYVRGAALTSGGLPDRLKQAQTYADMGNAYKSRRMVMLGASECAANVGGTEQRLAGYYLAAAYAGLTAAQAPQQPFTNFPLTGFTRVYGSNDIFSDKQLRIGAAGGTWWVLQDENGTAIYSRHQLTTDTGTVEKREYSITKVVDYVAKFLRVGLRTYIGRFLITQDFLDTIGLVLQGQLSYLQEAGIITGFSVNTLKQDTSNPDTLLIDVTLEVPYPCNFLKIVLVV